MGDVVRRRAPPRSNAGTAPKVGPEGRTLDRRWSPLRLRGHRCAGGPGRLLFRRGPGRWRFAQQRFPVSRLWLGATSTARRALFSPHASTWRISLPSYTEKPESLPTKVATSCVLTLAQSRDVRPRRPAEQREAILASSPTPGCSGRSTGTKVRGSEPVSSRLPSASP